MHPRRAGARGALGLPPSTVVAGLALSFVPYAGLLAVSRSLAGCPRCGWSRLRLLFGAPLVLAPPLLSDDLYRYLWEGRLWLEGFNPYRLAPDDLALAPLRDELWLKINNNPLGSIYPPLSQLLFAVAAWLGGKVWTVKLLALVAHVVTVVFVARIAKSPQAPLALALNPLLLSESALNGHFDILCGLALLVTAWALAQHRFLQAGIAACAAVGLKVVGLALLPLFVRRPKVLLGATFASALLLVPLVVSRAPVDPVSGAGQFASRWRGNESLFALADWVSRQGLGDSSADLAARAVVVLALLVLCALVVKRRVPSVGRCTIPDLGGPASLAAGPSLVPRLAASARGGRWWLGGPGLERGRAVRLRAARPLGQPRGLADAPVAADLRVFDRRPRPDLRSAAPDPPSPLRRRAISLVIQEAWHSSQRGD